MRLKRESLLLDEVTDSAWREEQRSDLSLDTAFVNGNNDNSNNGNDGREKACKCLYHPF